MKRKTLSETEKQVIEDYIKTASPYPTLEEFCILNGIDLYNFTQSIIYDDEAKALIRKLNLKAYTILEKYLILDTSSITFGKDGKEYKLDKKGLIYKLEELKKLLDS